MLHKPDRTPDAIGDEAKRAVHRGGVRHDDAAHGELTRRLALSLFDQLRYIHGMGEEERLILDLGARLCDGRQWMSWVHIDDHVAMTLRLLQDESLSGPFNLTASEPATNADFTQALARAVHRPAWFVTPAFLLRLALGERASLLLEGQRVLPERMRQLGFQHRFPYLAHALKDVSARKPGL